MFYFLSLIWLSHFIQVLVPETGFDAVWYHLPVVDSILTSGKILFFPELYQSLNPLFSDLFFMLGYFFLGETGTKLVAYLFALSLITVTYKLSRIFLSPKLSLAITILVSTFQVVSWQSASFYVDIAKAFWEVLAVLFIIKSIDSKKITHKVVSILAFSASLATKLFSLFLLPVYLFVYLWASVNEKKFTLWYLFPLLLLFFFPIYFYINSYLVTGNPFYSFSIHLDKLSEISGQSSLLKYFFQRSLTLPISPVKLIFSRDYVSPLISILLISVFLKIRGIIRNKKLSILLVFSVSQWLLWWYLPPLSTRYALSGFITLLILEIHILKNYSWGVHKYKITAKKLTAILLIFATINFLPRLFVNYRSLKYLFGNQTKKQYIEQFYDGSIDQKLKDWHGY